MKTTLGFGLAAVTLAAIAGTWLWALPPRIRPPVSMVVRQFITNQYSAIFVRDSGAPVYFLAVIDVTNTSENTFACQSSSGWKHEVKGSAPMAYYAYRDGGFGFRFLPPHSGFSFEVPVERGNTNQVPLDLMEFRRAIWPFLYRLPASIFDKLPDFLSRDRVRVSEVATKPFTLGGTLP